MINTDAAYPPMEGPITENPDTGEPYHGHDPVLRGAGDRRRRDALQAADGGTVTLTHTPIANPGYQRLASFTSGGPRNGDSAVKPDVTAPGVPCCRRASAPDSGPRRSPARRGRAGHATGSAAL